LQNRWLVNNSFLIQMNLDYEKKLIAIDDSKLIAILNSFEKPVMEFELLKKLKLSVSKNDRNLYDIHFSLFHALYNLKFNLLSSKEFLHISSMNIKLTKYPDIGKCKFYFEDRGFFCNRNVVNDSIIKQKQRTENNYCSFHDCYFKNQFLDVTFDPLTSFYLNPENILWGNSKILKKVLNGFNLFSSKKGEVEEALNFMDVKYPTKKILKNKYKELAFLYHPDKKGGDESLMKRLNYSYLLLKDIFI